MKKSQPLGLVVEGKLTGSVILRLPAVLSDLGPVKAKNTRLARRVSNFLRAGYAIESYEELEEARLVLIQVPDPAASAVISEISRAPVDFGRMAFVLCETWLPCDVLQPLAELGAATASSILANSSRGKWVLLEGDPAATRQMRRLLDGSQLRAIELRRGGKDLLFAAELLAGLLPIALLSHAEQALRTAGLSGNQLYALLEGTAQKMFADVVNHRHRDSAILLSGCSTEVARAHLQALRKKHPVLSAYLQVQLDCAGLSEIANSSATLR